jgi:hypothetical protein
MEHPPSVTCGACHAVFQPGSSTLVKPFVSFTARGAVSAEGWIAPLQCSPHPPGVTPAQRLLLSRSRRLISVVPFQEALKAVNRLDPGGTPRVAKC